MKTRWALFLPVLWSALLGETSQTVAQLVSGPGVPYQTPSANPSAAVPAPVKPMPLGVPSALGRSGEGQAVGLIVDPHAALLPGGIAPTGGWAGPWAGPAMAIPPGSVAPAYYAGGPPMDGAIYGPTPMMDPNYAGTWMPEDQSIGGQVERGFDLLRRLGPYPAGGWCSPRWFDVAADFVYLRRDEVSRTVNFTSDGPRGLGDPFIVLSTDNLDFDRKPGFRFQAAVQFGASSNVEFTYLGLFNFAELAAVADPDDNLYSVFSDFGNNPPPQDGPPIVRGGFTDTDSAEFHSIEYSSSFDSFDLGFRRHWMAPNCRIQGSWIAGVRYFWLKEDFIHRTRVNYPDPNGGGAPDITGFMDYFVGTRNSLTGFQLGGDLWLTLVPGIQFGTELKAGIYGNHASQRTTINAQTLVLPVEETARRNSVAFLSEANLVATWRVNQHLTARGGYTFLFVDGVALAPENFNPGPPFIDGARTVFINDNGNLFYHGFTAGVEWMW